MMRVHLIKISSSRGQRDSHGSIMILFRYETLGPQKQRLAINTKQLAPRAEHPSHCPAATLIYKSDSITRVHKYGSSFLKHSLRSSDKPSSPIVDIPRHTPRIQIHHQLRMLRPRLPLRNPQLLKIHIRTIINRTLGPRIRTLGPTKIRQLLRLDAPPFRNFERRVQVPAKLCL